jgi:hypothetical protein
MATSLKGKSVEARENGSDILGEFLDQGIPSVGSRGPSLLRLALSISSVGAKMPITQLFAYLSTPIA